MSAPQITESDDSLDSDVAAVVVVAVAMVVVVLALLRAFFTLVESEDELQADTSTRPRTARQGNIRFCIPPLCMKYTTIARSSQLVNESAICRRLDVLFDIAQEHG